MFDDVLTEEPLQFGEGGRLFGILTLPREQRHAGRKLPVFVFFSAGLLHRVGPFGLYVRLARNLAKMGFSSLRVDLAGRGDSPEGTSLTGQQSLAKDYAEIVSVLESRLGSSPLVLGGLCYGADCAILLAPTDSRVIGMLLLDPVCARDDGFRTREVIMKYTNPTRYLMWVKRHLNLMTTTQGEGEQADDIVDPMTLRDVPTGGQLQAAFQSICKRKGRVLSVLTGYALSYYNRVGQLGKGLNIIDYNNYCTEIFWPQASHTYSIDLHRRRLIEECKTWAAGFTTIHDLGFD